MCATFVGMPHSWTPSSYKNVVKGYYLYQKKKLWNRVGRSSRPSSNVTVCLVYLIVLATQMGMYVYGCMDGCVCVCTKYI